MKKKIVKMLSMLMISVMALAGAGMGAQATGGTGDATLASLEVSPGTLSPEFSSDCYEYSVEVGEDCDKLLVNAQTTDGGAKAVIAGNSGLKAGLNSVIINVTAADGVTTARYTIQVARGGIPADISETQGSQSQASGGQIGGGIASSPLISGNLPGAGAESPAGETGEGGSGNSEDGEAPDAAESSEGGENPETGAGLEDGAVPASGEIPETGGAAGTVSSAGRTYTLSVPDEAMVPAGFQAVEILIAGQTVPAWQFPSNYEITGQYLIYGTNQEGKTSFYIYDEGEGTVITAAEGMLAVGQEGKISQNQLRNAQEAYQKSLRSRMLVIVGLAVTCFILLIALTASLTRKKRCENEGVDSRYERPSPDDDEDDDYYGEPDQDLYDDDFYDDDGADENPYGDYGAGSGSPADGVEDGGTAFEDGDDEDLMERAPEEAQKKKLLTEAEPEAEAGLPEEEEDQDQEEWDTAPLPNLEDTGRLEPVRPVWPAEGASGEGERTAEPEEKDPEDFDLENIDLVDFDLEMSDPEGPALEEPGSEAAAEFLQELETEAEYPADPEAAEEYPEDPEMTEESSEEPKAAKEYREEPEVRQESPEEPDLEDLDLEEAGFEEITLEEIGLEEIRAEEAKGFRPSSGEPHPEEEAEKKAAAEKVFQEIPEENEEEPYVLPEEDEDEDLDAEFDLLDALLSDSVRSGRPDGANSIVNRAAEKAGRAGRKQEKKPVNPVRDLPAKPRKKPEPK